jgi:hypothetical protein
MRVNTEKFQVIIFSRNGFKSQATINVDGTLIRSQNVVKLLGLNFDHLLTFDVHVDDICRKAGRKLNVLARMSNTLDIESKLILFYAFVLSHFEYCAVVWHFCSRDKMRKIEKIQKQALRYVFNDYTSSYKDLLKKANRSLLYVQRLRSLLCLVKKCITKAGPIYLNDMFILNEGSNSRMYYPLVQHKFSTIKYGFNSIRYQGSRWWNLLDTRFKVSSCLKEWHPQCTCATCDLCILMLV